MEPDATLRLLTALSLSGTNSLLHAFAVKSQTRIFPFWSPLMSSPFNKFTLLIYFRILG